MISTEAFGKNDIRGVYGKTVTEELFYHTGHAYGEYLRIRTNKPSVSVAVVKDVRLHSVPLAESLIKGLIETGVNVIDLGTGPTPFGYFAEYTDKISVDGALIVTASHNPSEYNGLKMTCLGQSLNEEQIKDVKELTRKFIEGELTITSDSGKYKKFNMVKTYTDYLKNLFGTEAKDIHIVTDCANAAAGVVAPQLLKECGFKVTELYTEPDGTFPNHHPNPSIESTLDVLKKTVRENNADVGIAFDGDADRIGVIDSEGNYLTGDKLLYIYAYDALPHILKDNRNNTVVSEVKCSQVLFDSLKNIGADALMCKTGHGYIKNKMLQSGALLAGEMSGHMFFKDTWFGFDDAVYAAVRLATLIYKYKSSNKSFKLQEILKPFDKVTTSPEYRYPCPDEFKKTVLKGLENKIETTPDFFGDKIHDIIKTDGLRVVFDGGFAMIRQSNTEPVFTLRFESRTPELCKQYSEAMMKELDKLTKAEALNE